MPLEISEIRPDDQKEIDALLDADQRADGVAAKNTPPRCESVLSLVARDDGRVVGTILCYHEHHQGYVYQLTISDPSQHDILSKSLVDKALRKLKAQGNHRCRIRVHDAQQRSFWEAVKWVDRPELTQKPMPSTAVKDRLASQQETTDPPEVNDQAASQQETADPPEGDNPVASQQETTDPPEGDNPVASQQETTDPPEVNDQAASQQETADPPEGDNPVASQQETTDPPEGDDQAASPQETADPPEVNDQAASQQETTDPPEVNDPVASQKETSDPPPASDGNAAEPGVDTGNIEASAA